MKPMNLLLATLCLVMLASCASIGARTGTGAVYRPDLTEDKFAAIRIGDSTATLKAKLGEPYQRMRFEFLRTTAWDYRFMDIFGYWSDMSYMIDDEGRIKDIVRSRISAGKDDR
jgi:hypothetical protein